MPLTSSWASSFDRAMLVSAKVMLHVDRSIDPARKLIRAQRDRAQAFLEDQGFRFHPNDCLPNPDWYDTCLSLFFLWLRPTLSSLPDPPPTPPNLPPFPTSPPMLRRPPPLTYPPFPPLR